MKTPQSIIHKLQERKNQDAFRELSQSDYSIDFYSNDYLGFARNKQISVLVSQILESYPQSKWQNGATGSRLISGNYPLYDHLEKYLKNFHKASASLVFNSGYDANVGIFSSIPQRDDLVLFDQYIHASIRDGITMGKAKSLKFKHNDLVHLQKLLSDFSNKHQCIYVVTESVFSMDGDSPDLPKLVLLCQQYNAYLIIDEAHGLGVFGSKGEGLVQSLGLEKHVFIRLMTFGKALGCHGAVVLSTKETIDFLINFSRSFIYTTALSSHSVATILAGYQTLQQGNQAERLQKNILYFRDKIKQSKMACQFKDSVSPIQVFFVYQNIEAKQLALKLQQQSLGVKAILSPTVPKGQERLRVCLHSYNSFQEIDLFFDILSK